MTEHVIDFEHAAGIAGNQYGMIIITELVRFFVLGALMQKSVGQIALHTEDEFETGFFSSKFFTCPVKDIAMIAGADGGHAVLYSKVYVVLVFGAAIKDRSFVIMQVITEIILLYFNSPPLLNGQLWRKS